MSASATSLVIGGDGLIGRALVAHMRRSGFAVVATSRRPGRGDLLLDLAGPDRWPDLPAADAAVIVAAVARLADCERDPAGARQVNVAAPTLLAERLAARGTWCLLLSTDKVFDGSVPLRRRDDLRCPLTEYGGQKAAAERAVLAAGGAVLRLSKVVAPDLPLLQDWRRKLAAGEAISPFHDMRLAPVTVAAVVELIARLAADRRNGIFHCSGAEDRSYVALAEAVADAVGADRRLIQPATAPPELAGGVLVPHSTLDMSRETALYGIGNASFETVMAAVAAGPSA